MEHVPRLCTCPRAQRPPQRSGLVSSPCRAAQRQSSPLQRRNRARLREAFAAVSNSALRRDDTQRPFRVHRGRLMRTVAMSSAVHLVKRREVVQEIQGRPRRLVPAADEKVRLVRALRRRGGMRALGLSPFQGSRARREARSWRTDTEPAPADAQLAKLMSSSAVRQREGK